jgi:hypothetical protein
MATSRQNLFCATEVKVSVIVTDAESGRHAAPRYCNTQPWNKGADIRHHDKGWNKVHESSL